MKWFDKLKKAMEPGDQTKRIPSDRGEPASPASSLFPREKEVFLHLLDGEKMKDIAEELHIKTSTVNGYCREIYRKLGVNSKAQLILQYSSYRKTAGKPHDRRRKVK